MADPQYLLLFQGELAPGCRRREVLDRLTQLTNRDADSLIDQLFAIKPLIIKRGGDLAFLEHFRQTLITAGLSIDLRQDDAKSAEIDEIDFVFAHYAPIEEAAPQLSQAVLMQNPAAPRRQLGRHALLFEGQLADGLNQRQVIRNLASLCNCSERRVSDELFSVVPLLLATADQRVELEQALEEYQRAGLLLSVVKTERCDETLPLAALSIRHDRPEVTLPHLKRWPFPALVGTFCLSISLLWLQGMLTQPPKPVTPSPPSSRLEIVLNAPPDPVVKPAILPSLAEAVAKAAATPAPAMAVPKPPPPAARARRVATSPPAPPPEQAAPTASEPPPAAPVTTGIDIARLSEAYDNRVRLWLAEHQSKQSTQGSIGAGRVTLAVELNREGRLLSGRVSESSGHAALDAQALADLKAASPFPAMPVELTAATHALTIRILYRETQ
ncbi:MAG TPA: energy transducer TonB [Pseudomonadales bacterium]|jgi:protein TonB|nr:energy transducer TonB [Pseudomonadales bacterium]HMY96372.1 energy transducer TonB [Pseudomonadales bacterium]HMZ71018.1 energy transducer TonB [Pseudomonadales bacterium]HMZ91887.1 energy transducer TonB [Pseudomonadales bacterium]HNB84229.1 energy transducer TonB [Pseudomonadales bacterium]